MILSIYSVTGLKQWPDKSTAAIVAEFMGNPEAESELVALDWPSIIQTMRDRRKLLFATVFAEGQGVWRGNTLRVVYPKESDFYAKEAQKPRHLELLEEIVEEHTGKRPNVVFEIRQ